MPTLISRMASTSAGTPLGVLGLHDALHRAVARRGRCGRSRPGRACRWSASVAAAPSPCVLLDQLFDQVRGDQRMVAGEHHHGARRGLCDRARRAPRRRCPRRSAAPRSPRRPVAPRRPRDIAINTAKMNSRRRRNLSFNTNIFEFALRGDFNFFKFIPTDFNHSFTPYATLGVGVFSYDPYAYL